MGDGGRLLGVQARGALFGLGAAALFGLSAPLAKILLVTVPPVLLAGLLYCGASAGLWMVRAFRPRTGEAPLRAADVPALLGVVLSGGIVGPVLMLYGLQRLTAVAGSLLLNLEGPLTMLLAVTVFREHLGRSSAAAGAFILAGALTLKLEPGALSGDTMGVLLLAAACLCWALDNNLTQKLSLHDPFAIVRVKTLIAGATNVTLGLLVAGGHFPEFEHVLAALGLGSLSYGVSVVLDAYALRLVGAAREAAYFATAPFVGALASVLLFDSSLRWFEGAAILSMAVGVVLLLRERHSHRHRHPPLDHEHLHAHDQHHQHEHAPGDPVGSPHSHPHHHGPLVHDHPHLPDVHHRHRH